MLMGKLISWKIKINFTCFSITETHSSGRDEFCGLRFITVKAGPRSAATFSSGTSQNEIPHFNNNNKSPPSRQSSFQQTTPKVKKRLRYCYECARSIGKKTKFHDTQLTGSTEKTIRKIACTSLDLV